VTEIQERIAELEAQRSELVSVPLRGAVGRTSIDLTANLRMIDDELGRLRVQLTAARAGGTAERTRWGC